MIKTQKERDRIKQKTEYRIVEYLKNEGTDVDNYSTLKQAREAIKRNKVKHYWLGKVVRRIRDDGVEVYYKEETIEEKEER